MQLPSLSEYLAFDAESQRTLCRELVRRSAHSLTWLDLGQDNDLLPTFLHERTQLEFKLVFAHQFVLGLSEKEEQAARRILDPPPLSINEMRPVNRVDVAPFLASLRPVLVREYLQLGGEGIDQAHAAYLESSYQLDYPAYVTHEQATTLAHSLGCRLPWETEWECLCRAGSETLFVWGDTLPSDEELARWLITDFSGKYHLSQWSIPSFSEEFRLRCNSFGFYGLFAGEWCQDEYRASYDPNVCARSGEHAARGGGSLFWPWQDQEWVWCVSAMRIPSSSTLDGRCGFRLVCDI